jgi:hypothetical protein
MPPRAVGCDLVAPVEQLGIDTEALDKTVDVVTPASAALVTLDVEYVELAAKVAEYDRAVTGHVSWRPSECDQPSLSRDR